MDACSFCAASRASVGHLVVGPVSTICDRCVVRGATATPTDAVTCSFCGTVPACLSAVPHGVCPACLLLCAQIIAEAKPAPLPVARVRR